MVHPTPSQPGTHNGVKQVTPPSKPIVTPQGTPAVAHQGTTPHAVPTVTPQTPSSTPTKVNTSTPGFFDRIINYFIGDQKKDVEPGIHNSETEAYRTNDAKEAEYKDTIIQDDKNVTLPKKHLK